eukprot:747364-Hanusia_phi.AAC.2
MRMRLMIIGSGPAAPRRPGPGAGLSHESGRSSSTIIGILARECGIRDSLSRGARQSTSGSRRRRGRRRGPRAESPAEYGQSHGGWQRHLSVTAILKPCRVSGPDGCHVDHVPGLPGYLTHLGRSRTPVQLNIQHDHPYIALGSVHANNPRQRHVEQREKPKCAQMNEEAKTKVDESMQEAVGR